MDLRQLAQSILSGGRTLVDNSKKDYQMMNDPSRAGESQGKMQDMAMGMVTGGITNRGGSISKVIPTKLLKLGDDFKIALENVSQGQMAKSKLPILATPLKNGMYEVGDGNHRLAKMMTKGVNEVEVITDEKAYRSLADLEDKHIESQARKYIKDLHGKFLGSESVDKALNMVRR